MDNASEQSKRKVRPAQRLYVPPAQRCRKNKTMEENKEIVPVNCVDSTDIINTLQERLEATTLSDNKRTLPKTREPPQINANKPITKHKIETADADSEEMNRAMVNINRKSRHTNYLPANDLLHFSNESKPNIQVSNWEDLVNEDDEGIDSAHNDNQSESFDDEDADEAGCHQRRYNHNLSDLDHVIELYDFPATLRTQDLITLYNLANSDSSYVKWCDETHALLVVGTAAQALRALDIKHDIVKSRPITSASSIAMQTIEKCDLRPAMKRPQTSMHTARRMITSALGTKANISVETQKMERLALRKAKELKRTQKQNEQDAWEGNPRPSTA